MAGQRKDQYGRTEAFYVEEALREAKRDIVSFGDIVTWGRNFEVTDAELDAFVRKILRALLSAGVKVVRPMKVGAEHRWEELKQYNASDIEGCIGALVGDSNSFDDAHFAWFAFQIPSTWPHVTYDPRAT